MQVEMTIDHQKLLDNPFITEDGQAAFYKLLVEEIDGLDKTYDEVEQLDCTRILISADIQDDWIETIRAQGREDESIMMMLANWGPKAAKHLNPNTVVLEEGALRFSDGLIYPQEN